MDEQREPRYWRCLVCRKTSTSLNPDKAEAAPEHLSHRGFDIGRCDGIMGLVSKEEWDNFQSAEPMKRNDIIHRRYEAMRMRWPEKAWVYFTREALSLASRFVLRERPHA